MPTPDSYKGLTEDELRERLARAETICLLFGWSANGAAALTQAWMEWAHYVGNDYTAPTTHPDLNALREQELARAWQEFEQQTTSRKIGEQAQWS